VGDRCQLDSLEVRLQRAVDLKNEGQYDEALTEYKAILDENPASVPARLGLGLVLCFMGDFDESIEELRRAVNDGPDCIDTHLNLAKTYAMLGMYDEARVEFVQVLALCPQHKEAQRQIAFFDGAAESE
jgi:tetratricopeptide (TPR) repeat protein